MDTPRARGGSSDSHAVPAGVGVEIDPAAARAVIAPLYDDKTLATGEHFLAHADGIVEIVRELRDDADLLAAAYLFGAHDVLREPDEWLRSRFGTSVAQLVNDLRTLTRLSERTRPREGGASGQAEALRKMLLAMVNDLRVVLLRLASRLQTLRYFAANGRTDVTAFARETIELFAPLANRLGVWQMKWELEDLAFSIIEPEVYRRVGQWVDQRQQPAGRISVARPSERRSVRVRSLPHPESCCAQWGQRRCVLHVVRGSLEIHGRPDQQYWRDDRTIRVGPCKLRNNNRLEHACRQSELRRIDLQSAGWPAAGAELECGQRDAMQRDGRCIRRWLDRFTACIRQCHGQRDDRRPNPLRAELPAHRKPQGRIQLNGELVRFESQRLSGRLRHPMDGRAIDAHLDVEPVTLFTERRQSGARQLTVVRIRQHDAEHRRGCHLFDELRQRDHSQRIGDRVLYHSIVTLSAE